KITQRHRYVIEHSTHPTQLRHGSRADPCGFEGACGLLAHHLIGLVFRTIRAMNRASESCRCGQSWSVPAVVDSSRGWGKGSRQNSGCEPRKAVIRSSVSITVAVATE